MIPQRDPTLLPADHASYCRDVKFYSGRLEGFAAPRLVKGLPWGRIVRAAAADLDLPQPATGHYNFKGVASNGARVWVVRDVTDTSDVTMPAYDPDADGVLTRDMPSDLEVGATAVYTMHGAAATASHLFVLYHSSLGNTQTIIFASLAGNVPSIFGSINLPADHEYSSIFVIGAYGFALNRTTNRVEVRTIAGGGWSANVTTSFPLPAGNYRGAFTRGNRVWLVNNTTHVFEGYTWAAPDGQTPAAFTRNAVIDFDFGGIVGADGHLDGAAVAGDFIYAVSAAESKLYAFQFEDLPREDYTGMGSYFAYAPEDKAGAADYDFLRWAGADVDAVRGVVPSDKKRRVYFTGDGDYPQMTYNADTDSGSAIAINGNPLGYPETSYRLGVPAPSNAPTLMADNEAPADAEIEDVETRAYAYTLVTQLGEEGALSPPSGAIRVLRVGIMPTEWDIGVEYTEGDWIFQENPNSDPSTLYYVCNADHTSEDGDVENGAPDQTNQTRWDFRTWAQQAWTAGTIIAYAPGTGPVAFYVARRDHAGASGNVANGAPDQSNSTAWRRYGTTVELSPAHPWTGRMDFPNRIDRMRLYRQAVGASGAVGYLFVDELDYSADATAEYYDGEQTSALGEANQSLLWQPPPGESVTGLNTDGDVVVEIEAGANLHSLAVMANGFLIGASRNQVCVSEPNLPHAWNSLLRLNLAYDIVGIGVFATTAVALTREDAHLITGVSPSNLSAVSARIRQGCISKRGIVSVGHEGVVYPSPDGLFHISDQGVTDLTAGYIERLQWQRDFEPGRIVASFRERMYFAFYPRPRPVPNQGEDELPEHFIFDPTAGGSSGMTYLSDGALSGAEGDLDGVYNDALTDSLFIFTNTADGIAVHLFDDHDSDEQLEYEWHSKVFDLQRPVRFRCIRADLDEGSVSVGFEVDGEVLVNDDDTPYEVELNDSHAVRLGEAVRGRHFKLLLKGTGKVRNLVMAETLRELVLGV